MVASPAGIVTPSVTGSAPIEAPCVRPSESGIAVFLRMFHGRVEELLSSADPLASAEAEVPLPSSDDATASSDVWAAIWFPNLAPVSHPQAPALLAVGLPLSAAVNVNLANRGRLPSPTNREKEEPPAVAGGGERAAVLDGGLIFRDAACGVAVGSGAGDLPGIQIATSAQAPSPKSPVARDAAIPNRAGPASDSGSSVASSIPLRVAEVRAAEITTTAAPTLFDARTSIGDNSIVIGEEGAFDLPTSSGPSSLAPTALVSSSNAPVWLRDPPPLPAPPTVLDLRHPQAPAQLAESIAWHLAQGVHEVTLDLHPLELGRMEIRLRLEGDRVELRFDTAEGVVRDVVQTSLPHLAAMLSARGLQLDQAQVFAQIRSFTPPPFSSGQPITAEAGSGRPRSSIAGFRATRRGQIDDYV